ncbi:alpha/beta hydrolase [Kitasatospora sp. NPDC097605]|uniref:alpha/beta fold hydrolase n=1 Tax=Kitasatospora sp. NPDC097605 TaxID=3157226 RepID=UPI00332B12A2
MHRSSPLPPTVVLVHGAFADTALWAGVGALLRADGLTVRAPANPLRGLAHDAARIAGVLRGLDGPVVLVGHDYGGAVITRAAADADNVVALCYVAGFGLDAGECVLDVVNRFAPAPVADALVIDALVTDARATGVPAADVRSRRGLSIRAELFPHVYAADLPPGEQRLLAAAQRPIACAALAGRSGPPAWAARPSWYAIATADRVVNPTAQRFMAQRMAATEHLLDGSHAVALSRPEAVAGMIREAAGLGRRPLWWFPDTPREGPTRGV